jgi:hypothetical protein
MPQETNLNVSPYFDDFDKDKNHHRVLFKPGYPVQARELTTLQSILQNQVEQFGSHFFKEGAKVIPGQLTYVSNFYAVEINIEFSGVPVSLYLDNLVDTVIYGRTSGVKAKVVKVITSEESERGNATLYVDYLESSSSDLSKREFDNGEVLYSETAIQIGNTFISPSEGFATTISENSTSTGSAFALSNGVYFLRGTFVEVQDEILILDQYTNTPSYRVGLLINEEIITSDEDISLTDNSQGYSNYSAPGADRLKISATLFKKDINDFDNANFVQLATVQNGVLREINNNTDYNILGDELARRTFDESGHYYIKSFTTYCKESLNNGLGNGGIFKSGELTYSGSVPSEDLAIYKVSPGKAYVKGYEVEFQGPTFLNAPKPRTTKTIESQSVNFGFGPTLIVNNVTGSPLIDFNTTTTLSLRDERVTSDPGSAPGNEIGVARVYDFVLEQGGYDVQNLDTNQWDLSLFDVQTYSKITVNEPITLSIPTYVRGSQTGATGYLKESVSSASTITVYQVKGEFSEKENIIFSGSDENEFSRYITDIRNYGISDIKSVYSSSVGSGITFTADTIQSDSSFIGISSISANIGGISTVTVSGTNISGIITTGNLIKYSQPGISTISYAKVGNVNYLTREFEISPVENVSGVVYGDLPTSPVNITDLSVLTTKLQLTGSSGNSSSNNSLFSVLPKSNIESVDLTGSQLTIRRQFNNINISSNSTDPIDAGTNEVFLPFDEERYILIRSDGSLETLTSDRFDFQSGSTRLIINNLGANDTGAVLIATLRKTKIKSKSKKKKIVDSIIIDKSSGSYSGIGQSTTNDGLTYGNYPYGTRVQDIEICLNYPDVNLLYAVFESKDTSNPDSPSATIGSMDGATSTTNDLIIGETLVGTISGARALYVERKSDTSIGYIYENNINFINGELVKFDQSNVNGVIGSINQGSTNVTDRYRLDNGQKQTYFDYSRIIRNLDSPEPERKIKVYFMRGFFDPSDDGDITTTNSYTSFDYTNEIPSISGYRVTDLIDLRPRVKDYTVSEGNRSPFEFDGRDFSGSNHSSKNIISSDESLILTYSYYLPRIDRIYLNKDKSFSVKYGNPSDNPVLPEEVSGAMNIANIYLPAYLYNTSDARIEFVQHKRYQMRDIFNLESRIKNLEYYTSLSMLETNTQNLFVDDGTGQNRFKSGFYVDNFTSLLTQDLSNGVKNSIDVTRGELRPSHYTTNLKLEVANNTITGIGTSTQSNGDKRYAEIFGSNIKRSGDVVTLDYSETSWLRQPFATRTENVTPFFVKLWEGSIQLYPSVDVWIDVNKMEIANVDMEGSFSGVAEALRTEISTNEDGERLGVSPVIWNSWETTGVDLNRRVEVNSSTSTSSGTSNSVRQGNAAEFQRFVGQVPSGGVPRTFRVGETSDFSTTTTVTTTNTFMDIRLDQQRTGIQNTVSEQIDTESLGDRIVRRDIVSFMRSRNIEFTSRRMKPFTQVYSFFDGVNVSDFCFSKLIEIEMISGTFSVGETVIGQIDEISTNSNTAVFRVAQSNHKYGPYNAPTDFFDRNPYNREVNIPEFYSSTSTTLNVDTLSLAEESNTTFSGIVKQNMILRGQSSGAEARVTNVRLVTDRLGTLIGSYQVPNGFEGTPQFETGRSRFRLTSSSTNSQIPGVVTTVAEETFYSQGDVDSSQEVTLSLRNARVDVDDSFRQTTALSDSALLDSQTTVSSTTTTSNPRLTGEYRDPLAQSFIVDDPTGVFLTKVDIYFRTKDETLPVTVQIREVELGTPSQKILAFSEVELTPDKVLLSEDASVATSFVFESPVYLESQREYAIIVISNSNEYNVWISRLGESDVATLATEQNQILVTTQRLLGSLFKSQNASTWTPSQYEDLTFELHRANFTSSGFVQMFNSDLPENLQVMTKDPLTIQSNRVMVSLSSTITNTDLTLGNTIIQQPAGLSTVTGNLVGYAGSAFGTLNVVNSGVGYTGSNVTYTGVALTSITGSGFNATANITINNGGVVASGTTVADGGFGYVVGDILEPISIGTQNLGLGMRLSVSEISGRNELIIDNVQGEFSTISSNKIKFINNSGVTTDFSDNGTELSIDNLNPITSGDHLKVFHRNHGMHSSSNIVTLRDIRSDVDVVSLTSQYPSATGNGAEISVSDANDFLTFENIPVSATYKGYIRISNELLSYEGVNLSTNTLTGVSREIDGTKGFNYPIGTSVEKYELGGVSLRRINKTHNLSDVDSTILNPIGVNYYYVKIDMSANGVDRSDNVLYPKLKFNRTKQVGLLNGKASYNIPFEAIIPNIKQIAPTGTSIKSAVRTVRGSSLGGNEVSFVDMGLQDITNSRINYFDSPRVIASKVNETNYLTDLPGNKSLNVNAFMATTDSRISPAIDLSNNSLVLISNRINSPVSDYANDPRVNTISDDPNLFTYISNRISLESPASSIKILLDAYLHNASDLRAFFSIEDSNVFVPFPGYANIDTNGSIIDARNSDGSSDKKMLKQDRFINNPSISDFKEYSFTVDLNESFKQFRVKLIGTSENQSFVPIIRNLRVIALA